jgi:hypothetical protein
MAGTAAKSAPNETAAIAFFIKLEVFLFEAFPGIVSSSLLKLGYKRPCPKRCTLKQSGVTGLLQSVEC